MAGYNAVKLALWSFIRRFRGERFSMGDARAYVSALADIFIARDGLPFVEALEEALRHARASTAGGYPRDYWEVYEEWLRLDRTRLAQDGFPSWERPEPVRERYGLAVVSLFTGAYGLDLGFEEEGYDVTVALDVSEDSLSELKANRPRIPFLLGDIKRFSTKDILEEAGLVPGEVDVVTGGPPCQPFSPAGKRRSLGDPRASALMEFIRVVREARPRAFVMEEVPGLLSARVKHVPIRERGERPPSPEEEPGSAWRVVLEELSRTGYVIKWRLLNAAWYGAPQDRTRIIVIGVRPDVRREPVFPEPEYGETPGLLGLRPYTTLAEALSGLLDPGSYAELPPKYSEYIKYVPPGGNWRQIPDELKPAAMNGALPAGGGRMGFYRRLCWFEPSPTLVTHPAMKATMLVHPWEDRPLSVREYMRLQGFPDEWRVVIGIQEAYRLFGEAVPVPLARAVARAVRDRVLMAGSH
ncbi:DNA cytosine methyltransferase [Infirmifilum lucidum]|uniref:DNA (cytosine-5-)-methyltransferase n=1 Tax=Infirmifilum lucidum TaxID=2776706 RepID=A0A7L9FGE5_9CREN|nr:DNA cytosine methyltransferase [Infirmifilum lucidum]QOJ78870.1 DNA cytosine methyltransferase [Infirmifilum lucidum]